MQKKKKIKKKNNQSENHQNVPQSLFILYFMPEIVTSEIHKLYIKPFYYYTPLSIYLGTYLIPSYTFSLVAATANVYNFI